MTMRSGVPSLGFRTQRLFGLDFVAEATIPEIADALVAAADERVDEWRCVVTPNVDHLVRYARIDDEADAARHATLALPDGMPIVWASRLLGRGLRSRLAGSDLMGPLWERLAERSIPAVVVASSEAVSDGLEVRHSRVRSLVPPQFDVADDAAVTSIIDWIDATVEEIDARVVVVGVSMPKHHLVANRLRERWAGRYLGSPIVMLLGASPDLFLGLTPRAPEWMRRSGLEWLHRLYLEPRRLAKRYFVDDVAFVRLVFREWRSSGSRRSHRAG